MKLRNTLVFHQPVVQDRSSVDIVCCSVDFRAELHIKEEDETIWTIELAYRGIGGDATNAFFAALDNIRGARLVESTLKPVAPAETNEKPDFHRIDYLDLHQVSEPYRTALEKFLKIETAPRFHNYEYDNLIAS